MGPQSTTTSPQPRIRSSRICGSSTSKAAAGPSTTIEPLLHHRPSPPASAYTQSMLHHHTSPRLLSPRPTCVRACAVSRQVLRRGLVLTPRCEVADAHVVQKMAPRYRPRRRGHLRRPSPPLAPARSCFASATPPLLPVAQSRSCCGSELTTIRRYRLPGPCSVFDCSLDMQGYSPPTSP